jgi:predicted nucleic acid-binding protein
MNPDLAGAQDPEVLMLDTNVFNHVLDGRIDPARLQGKRLVATHIQRDEILATGNAERRDALMALFIEFVPSRAPTSSAVAGISVAGASNSGMVPTESFVWDVSCWDEAKWPKEDGLFEALRNDLDDLNGGKANNVKDVLIAETALRNGWTLVTDDRHLAQVASTHGCSCANMTDKLGGGTGG